jgi:hypothetical protein
MLQHCPRGHHAVTPMPVEQLTYPQIAERLGVSAEASRALVRRHRLPRSRSNDGKTLVAVDLEEIRHKPMPGRSPRGHHPVAAAVADLTARIAALEIELAAEQQLTVRIQAELAAEWQRSAGHRADYELERDRADDLVAIQGRLVTELAALRKLLQAAQPADRGVTSRAGRWWRWMRSSA